MNETNNTPTSNGLARAACILGALSIPAIIFVFPVFVLAPIGIILALLSRGALKKLSGMALSGLIMSVASLSMCVIMLTSTAYVLLTDPQVVKQYETLYDQMYDYYYNGGEYPDIESFMSQPQP